jgi:hypothetical protein
MRKDQIRAKLTERETERNRLLAKVRYKIEQYFDLSALHQREVCSLDPETMEV